MCKLARNNVIMSGFEDKVCVTGLHYCLLESKKIPKLDWYIRNNTDEFITMWGYIIYRDFNSAAQCRKGCMLFIHIAITGRNCIKIGFCI